MYVYNCVYIYIYPDCGYSNIVYIVFTVYAYIYIQHVYTVTGRLIRYVHMLHVTPKKKKNKKSWYVHINIPYVDWEIRRLQK